MILVMTVTKYKAIKDCLHVIRNLIILNMEEPREEYFKSGEMIKHENKL